MGKTQDQIFAKQYMAEPMRAFAIQTVWAICFWRVWKGFSEITVLGHNDAELVLVTLRTCGGG